MPHDQGFPRAPLPPFEPYDDGMSLGRPAVVLQRELDAAYRVINALVRKYAGGAAYLEDGLADREAPVVRVERKMTEDGFTINAYPLH